MLPMAPPGPPLHAQLPGQPPVPLRPQAPGLLPQPGQSLNPQEHFQPPVLNQSQGPFHSDIAVGRGPGPDHFGHSYRTYDMHSSTPQGPVLSAVHPGPIAPQVGLMGRAPPHGPEGQFGLQRPTNPVDTKMLPNQRPHLFDGRQLDSHPPGSLERGPFGQLPGNESNMRRINGAPGLESLRDERFNSVTDERLNAFAMEPTRRFDQVSRPLDMAPRGYNYDAGERAMGVGLHDDNRGWMDSTHSHPDFLGPVSGFGRHQMERLTPRSPGREYPGIPSRGFGGRPHGQSGLDDIDSREPRSFGEGSRSFNPPSDPVGNSFHETRFPTLPGRMRKGELDGSGNLRMDEHLAFGPQNNWRGGDLMGQEIPPSHLRRGELLGPRNLQSHSHLGEPTGFGAFSGHSRMGELAGPGNFSHHPPFSESFGGNQSSHPRLGEPGFRSSYSLQGFPNEGGLYAGDMDPFDKSRKRKPWSTGWCRICKIDCETVEGLDLHSQTREHQKMTMDMVISIKQQNSKKQKTSNKHSALEEASKPRNAGFEGRGNKP
ncbi:unnamed protein product [Ilex paraguariensis]|uniref:Uncharacterized protein n=1 Tax=Ilex paraguariensis TaxID=185542 RepID=A0ABC8RXM1_9AQUA